MKENLAITSQSSLFHFIHRFIMKNGDNKKKIFEIGIGTGNFSLNLAIKGYEVYGCDYSYIALKKLNEFALNEGLNDNVGVVRADFENLPFKPAFSHVLSLGFIEHFNDPQKIVFKHRDLCQDGDYLFIDVPNSSGIWMKIYSLKRWIEQRKGHWKVGLEKSFSIKVLSKFLTSAGFEIIERFCADFKCAIRSAFSFKGISPVEKMISLIFNFLYILMFPLIKFFPDKKSYKYGFFAIIIGRKIFRSKNSTYNKS